MFTACDCGNVQARLKHDGIYLLLLEVVVWEEVGYLTL